mmetsp:Transcript_11755/g.15974  ORF Transcript_11755/g.15974 Transcript_11755/m.15974 type:complete len:151 (-) Transcript_11755:38-490(-)
MDGRNYLQDVVARWVLGYGLFMIFYYGFAIVSGTTVNDFDPSGHFACSLLSQANHASIYLFFLKKYPVSARAIEVERGSTLKKAALASFAFHQVHACYSLFFSGFIFHTVVESVIGYMFGLLLVGLTYETDLVVASLLTFSSCFTSSFSK